MAHPDIFGIFTTNLLDNIEIIGEGEKKDIFSYSNYQFDSEGYILSCDVHRYSQYYNGEKFTRVTQDWTYHYKWE